MPSEPSLETGLRKLRTARLRAWGIYGMSVLVLLCACPLSFQVDTPWKFVLLTGLPGLFFLIGYFQTDGLLCPRCGHWFFGNWFDHRGIFFSNACHQCGLRL